MTNGNGWKTTREKVLMGAGLTIVGAEFIASTFLGFPFRYEWVLAGLALCGVSITQREDRK